MIKIGIIKEGKTPPDKRVPLSPEQCERILNNYDNVEIYVQKSNIRKFSDRDYERVGIAVVDDVSHCDILMGVKEVPINELIADKKYLFFSHTFKEQPYNRELLQALIDKSIQLIDWEVITNAKGQRLIAFGRYAGIVGCYNGFLAYGLKSGLYNIKPAHQCDDRAEMEGQLPNIKLPKDFKAVITGKGRVGGGALEVIEKIDIKEVSPEAFLNETFDEAVYTVLDVADYYERDDMKPMNKQEFYKNPKGYHSVFPQYAEVANMYIACHYWDSESPFIFTREDAKSENFNIEIVADISCDIDCAVASTLQPSTIAEPLYGYNPKTESVVSFDEEGAIGVMAVDNLPCELPKDASESFGEMFIEHVLEPLLGNDPDNIIDRASETKNGKLNSHFEYLQDYLKG
jgi:alanine dehydrogenase